jgi:hypothetical protein
MQFVIPFEGGPLDGQQKLYRCETEISLIIDGGKEHHVYKVITVGPCKIPVKYKWISQTKQLHV